MTTAVADLATPAAVVDLARLDRNITATAQRAAGLGVALRPHVKTHKCVEIARLQVAAGSRGLTVSTLAEARHLAAAGFSDLTLAVPIAPQRLTEAVELAAGLERFAVLLDHPDVADAAARAARARGLRLDVFLEVDCGQHRSGVDPHGDHSIDLARRLADDRGLRFRGLLTHGGHAYHATSRVELEACARQERDEVTSLARRLRDLDVAVVEVSLGSTPGLAVVDHLDGVTEVRPGNSVFFDAFQAAMGVCDLADTAFSVLATVISQQPRRGELVIDAGALALSKDAGPTHRDPDCGFGRLMTVEGELLPTWRVVSLSQEHGVIRVGPAAAGPRWAPGARVRVIPNHSCLAAALFQEYAVIEDGKLLERWKPVRGW